jgi:hypothetical protein
MGARSAILALFDEAFDKKAWHGPNLWQALKAFGRKLFTPPTGSTRFGGAWKERSLAASC